MAAHPSRAALAFAEARAPRYTSYPTAAQFTSDVAASQQAAWLGDVPASATTSVYLHVPYCRRLCWYCGCNTAVANERAPVARLARQLLVEMNRTADIVGHRLATRFVHIGGGSPDVLAKADLDAIFRQLRRRFQVAADAEIAVELDPANVKSAWAKAAADNGVNRASLGVQTFAPHVQSAINRVQSPAAIENAVAHLRAAGIDAINFDLMYGLPRQKTADVAATVQRALQMRPSRVAVFGYAHVPWVKRNQRLIDVTELPGAAERLEQSEVAADELVRAGYVRIGLDHFALPHDPLAVAQAAGRLHRNFQGYTTDVSDMLIGIGPSAISRLPQGYVQNLVGTRDWSLALAAGGLAGARGVRLTQDDTFRAGLIETLMCAGRVDIRDLAAAPESFHRYAVLQTLAEFQRQGLLTRTQEGFELTEVGRPMVRIVCTAFDAYTDPSALTHAKAV